MTSIGTLYVISAPSGAGKTSLVEALVKSIPELVRSISHTTRAPRPAEQDGVNYHFVSSSAFQQLLQQHIFIEHAKVFGHDYGTSRYWVEKQLKQNKDVILEIDWQGARQIRQQFSRAISIFILPPSLDVLRARLQERAQDSEAVIEKRMQQAQAELSHYQEFDYLVVNAEFAEAVIALESIIRGQRMVSARQREVLKDLLQKLTAFQG